MQDKKDLKDQHPAAGPGLEGALGPCVKVGKENRGRQGLVRSDGYPEKVLCTQYPSTRCSTHLFFPARLENPYEGIIVVQW